MKISKRQVLTLILAVAGIYYVFLNNQEILIDESTRTVEYFHWQKMIVTYEKEAKINIEFNVIEGTSVDLMVFNKTGYNEFYYIITQNTGLFKPLTAELNTESASLQFNMPPDGQIYVIINNAGKIDNSAIPRGDVTLQIKISAEKIGLL